MRIVKEKKNMYQVAAFCLFMRKSPNKFVLLGENGKHLNEDDRKIKQQTNLDRHGPRPISNICHLPDPT